ncbi:MAG: hypothetical protein IKC94_02565 [Lentisphaeria bacterium]|nr:hypothetical protein [Lentisphaeria bacterium]
MSRINPLIPMGAITGRPSHDEIVKILTAYRNAGIEQYMIYPRSGCELEYLSDEYFDTVEMICAEAEKLGFKGIWLYDEFNWPSGSCANRVPLENPEFAAKFISAYRGEGKIEVAIKNNPCYTNVMDPSAVDRFIALTHERYYQRLGRYFGTLIKGIFTDEPDISFFKPPVEEIPLFFMGYYDGLENDYKELTGSDLFADIADGLRGDKYFYPTACASLLARRFRSTYIDRIQSWCTNHGIVLTGHLMNEYSTVGSRLCNGDILTVLSGMKLPGMDDILCDTNIDAFEFLTYSTALYAIEQQGNHGGFAELFGCCKCDIDFAKLQQVIFLAGAFGIDHYCLGLAAMDPRGNSIKKEYYDSFSWDIPHLAAFEAWSKMARRAAELAGRKRRYDVAVRYSVNAPDLPGLLRIFVSRQISWKLIGAEEPIPDDVQLVFNCGHQWHPVVEEINNTSAWSAALILERLGAKFQLSGTVHYPDGALVNDIFIRRYADGTILVIDMSGRDRELVLHRNNVQHGFRLSRFGVVEFPGWQLSFDHAHVMRLKFDSNGHAQVSLSGPQKLFLALRDYAGSSEITVDGKNVTADLPCAGLPASFNALYRMADLGEVAAGKHSFALSDRMEDFPYLPSAILLDSGTLPGYTGKVEQKARIYIPETALKIKTENHTPPGDVTLYLDGSCAGIRLTAPYQWLIPADLRGKYVEIKLVYSSSIAPLFGEWWSADDAPGKIYAPSYHGKPDMLEVIFE